MIILKNDCYLIAYKNCDFFHTFDLKTDINSDVFEAYLETKSGLVNFTINKDNTFLIVSLTETQINTINTDVCNFWIKKNNLPLVKGTITIKPF